MEKMTFKEKAKERFGKAKTWVSEHKTEIVVGTLAAVVAVGTVIIGKKAVDDAKQAEADWQNYLDGLGQNVGEDQNPLDLTGQKIWELHKVDEGFYMLQTDKSDEYDEAVHTKTVKITGLEVIDSAEKVEENATA